MSFTFLASAIRVRLSNGSSTKVLSDAQEQQMRRRRPVLVSLQELKRDRQLPSVH